MKVAIPLFGTRVSPHFASAPELLVVLAQEHIICSTMRFPFSMASLSEKKQKILSLGVDTLVCGGIDRETRRWLERRAICVMVNAAGEAEEILSHLLGLRRRSDGDQAGMP